MNTAIVAPWAQALTETLGEESVRRWRPFLAEVSPRMFSLALVEALEQRFGALAGQGVAVRIGQALFRHLPDLHPQATALPWRMLPVGQRVLQGLSWLLREVTPALGLEAEVDAIDEGWRIQVHWCASCTQEAAFPRCGLWQGFFQEALYWLTGRVYPVFLEGCRACGEGRCTFLIPRQPLY